jgi:hypothetical protein
MLLDIQKFFGGIGQIKINKQRNVYYYTVNKYDECLIIQNHFLNFPLLTYKFVYFQLWSQILSLISSGIKLTMENLLLIIALKAHFKKGLSNLLMEAFPNYVPILAPAYLPNLNLIDIHWLAGFIQGDGSFSLTVNNDKKRTLGKACKIYISICQNVISKIVLDGVKTFLGFGNVHQQDKENYVYKIGSLQNINTFINKFNEAQFLGSKALDYADFCKGIDLMNNKDHLTVEGLEQFIALSKGMNSTRTYFGD